MHEFTWLGNGATESVVLSSNLWLWEENPLALEKLLSLWVEYECDIPLEKQIKKELGINIPTGIY